MKLKKNVKKIITIIVIIVVVAILLGVGYLTYKRFFNKNTTTAVEIVDEIKEYGYKLKDKAPTAYEKMFKELVKVLKEEEVDEEAYASLVARMIVFDFYNLNEKISKNDIGGVQFVYSSQQSNFSLEASQTVYKYIEHNIYGNRTQELPIVTNTEIKSITTTTYKYKDLDDSAAYKAVVTVTYEEDLGYPTEVTVVMVHSENKLEVIKMY